MRAEPDCGGAKVVYGAAHFDPGSAVSKSQIATRSCTVEPIYWLEVPRDLHTCRHVAGSGACE